MKEIADEAKADLALAMPAMEAAQNALKALNKADINELKAFQKPPALVRFVMEPVCILMGVKLVQTLRYICGFTLCICQDEKWT